jgi:hypothetical protein
MSLPLVVRSLIRLRQKDKALPCYENKVVNGGVSFTRHDIAIKSPHPPRKPPQLHQQKTTSCTPFFQNTPAKTHHHHATKNRHSSTQNLRIGPPDSTLQPSPNRSISAPGTLQTHPHAETQSTEAPSPQIPALPAASQDPSPPLPSKYPVLH